MWIETGMGVELGSVEAFNWKNKGILTKEGTKIFDIVLKNDFSGNDKFVWVLVILLLPFIGATLYFLIGRGRQIKR